MSLQIAISAYFACCYACPEAPIFYSGSGATVMDELPCAEGVRSDPGTSIGGQIGFDYYKFKVQLASESWEKVFKITQWNYTAFSAAVLLSGTGLIAGSFHDKIPLIILICVFVLAVSVSSAILSYLYMNYAVYLFSRAWEVEKAWLRAKDGKVFLENDLRVSERGKNVYLERSNSLIFSWKEIRGLASNIYVQINFIPGALAILLFLAQWCQGL